MVKTIIYAKPLLIMKKYLKLGQLIYYSFKNKMMHYSYNYFKRKKKLTIKDRSKYSKYDNLIRLTFQALMKFKKLGINPIKKNKLK